MRKYTNNTGVPLSMAVFLATDNYDHEDDTISATSLLKPVRQLVLADRVPKTESMSDLSGMVASRMGSAIHDAIERSWTDNHIQAMTDLGYPKRVAERVKINPDPKKLGPDDIPVYLEIRSYKQFMGYKVSGKFDFVGEGRVEDFKTTSAYTWVSGKNDDKYILQGSIYRWLNPDIITQDTMAIQFMFTDWQARMAKTDPKYPSNRVMNKTYQLMSLQETEAFVRSKLTQYQRYKDAPEAEIPLCTDEELWRDAPKWKYYRDASKVGGRSTKNFDNAPDAYARLAKDGHKGAVVEQGGQVKACKYCPAFPVCTQKDQLIAAGDLKL